jgi:hypothetical protein
MKIKTPAGGPGAEMVCNGTDMSNLAKKGENNKSFLFERYLSRLRSIPPSGQGCHPALLGVANLGILAGLTAEQIFTDLRSHVPQSDKRRISDRELSDAVKKALSDHDGRPFLLPPKRKPPFKDGKAALRRIIDQGQIDNDADLWESSPVRLDWQREEDLQRFLSALYDPKDLIFIGKRQDAGVIGQTIRTTAAWIIYFQNGGKTAPHFIINPLNGVPVPKKTGDGETLRGDGNVLKFKYCLVEFDELSRADQIRFWSVAKLPVCALLDSAGKSIHALLDVEELCDGVTSLDEWAAKIKGNLYDRLLTPMGVDPACCNPARLSRLPGHPRGKKFQKILWLKEGKGGHCG